MDYTYDADGNRTARNTIYSQASYGYDDLNQLTNEINSGDLRGALSYGYDLAGNRIGEGFDGSASTETYTLDTGGMNRLISTAEGPAPLVAPASYAYDAEGNRTSKTVVPPPGQDDDGTTTYQWDGKDRLKDVALPNGTTIQYSYDYNNHQVTRIGADTRNYLYNGNQVLEEIRNGQRLALYGYDGQGLISRTDKDGRSLFYLWDGLGSCIGIIDQNGRILQNYEYSAYGENLSGKDAVNTFRYVGRYGLQQDDDTGLTYAWNRWLDTRVGRWCSEDLYRQNSDINLFAYVRNGPASFLDPTGLELVRVWLNGLGPSTRDVLNLTFALMVKQWIQLDKKDCIDLNFTEAFRTYADQGNLEQPGSGAITPATYSLHEAGWAVDVSWVALGREGARGLALQHAAEAGLNWGGFFGTPDIVHFFFDPYGSLQARISGIAEAQQEYSADNLQYFEMGDEQ